MLTKNGQNNRSSIKACSRSYCIVLHLFSLFYKRQERNTIRENGKSKTPEARCILSAENTSLNLTNIVGITIKDYNNISSIGYILDSYFIFDVPTRPIILNFPLPLLL